MLHKQAQLFPQPDRLLFEHFRSSFQVIKGNGQRRAVVLLLLLLLALPRHPQKLQLRVFVIDFDLDVPYLLAEMVQLVFCCRRPHFVHVHLMDHLFSQVEHLYEQVVILVLDGFEAGEVGLGDRLIVLRAGVGIGRAGAVDAAEGFFLEIAQDDEQIVKFWL